MDVVSLQCPWCFEVVEIDLDPETEGDLVQDCEVCCNPWQLHVTRDEDGTPSVQVDRAQ
jgi:hypothetical protein